MYVRGGKAAKLLDVSQNALRGWADSGKIRHVKLPNGDRRYLVDDLTAIGGTAVAEAVGGSSRKVIYARVSTAGQRDELQRQIDMLKSRYPGYDVVSDVASGLNFKRKGLRSLLERALSRQIDEVVVAHRDRLARFAYDLLSWVFQKHGVKVVVHEQTMDTPEQELVDDLLSIVTVFACRSYGRRSHQTRRSKAEEERAAEGPAGGKQSEEDQGVSVAGG